MHMFSGYNRQEDSHPHKNPYTPGVHPAQWNHDQNMKKIKKNPRVTAFGEWIKIVEDPHTCSLPDVIPYDIGVGSIWQCHKCKAKWAYKGTDLKAEFSKIYDNTDTAYCVKCKENVPMKDRKTKVSDSGRKMAFGTCGNCGTKVNRILGKED